MIVDNKIYCGDNLEILKSLDNESVDLIYIDPPFFTNKDFAVIWNDGAEIRQFKDRWISLQNGKYSKDINVYLNWMEPRIKELHRILKPTGSFYLHCDYHANSYLRILCDGIFRYNNLQREIIWWRNNTSGGKSRTNNFIHDHDTILYYTKSNEYTFNKQYLDYGKKYIKRFKFNDNDGLGLYRKRGVNPIRKQYLSESKGKILGDVWNIHDINVMAIERLGYPTQKPEALLERIIKASSNEGDVVLDCFSGGGTTVAVAKRLGRKYIGIEVSPTACRVNAKRLGIPINKVIGMPINSDEIEELDGWEFQNYVIHLLDPLTTKNIKINKRGADGGIDGYFYEYPIEIKQTNAGRRDLDIFVSGMNRDSKTEGIFITRNFAGTFSKEVARLEREDNIKVHMFTLEQIINGEHNTLRRKIKEIEK